MLSDPRVMGALRLAQREGVSMDVAMRLLAAASADAEDSAASPAQGAGGRGPSSAAATASVTPGGPAPEPHADLAGAGPTRRRSPSVQAIVPVRHGRRVKVVTRWDAAERAAAAEAAERKAQKQAAKLAKAESAKVRQVRWGVLTEADVAEGSMWARQSGEGEAAQESGQAAASEVDDLMGRVKLAFAKVAPAQGRGGGGADSKPAKARAAKPTKVSLIADAKTQRALGIGIAGAVRGTTLDELSKGIAQLDADALGGLDAAEALLGMMEEVPPEAEAAVRSFQGDPSTLDLPEQFILRCVVEVPRAKERLALATAQASLSDSMRIVRQRAELVEKACAEVRGSWRFRFLLRDVVVPIGNQLNAGTKLGQAAGVRIDTLSSLVQTRAADNRTFLRFIVEGLVESDDGADLLHVVDDFPTITGTAPAFFAWDALTSETAALRKGSALASKVLVIPEVEADAELLGRVQAMASDAAAAAAAAAEAFASCRASFDGICEFLGVPQGEMPPDKLFPHIATFIELVAKDTNFHQTGRAPMTDRNPKRLEELAEARREFQRITEGAADVIARAFHEAKQRNRSGDAKTLRKFAQECVDGTPSGNSLTVVEGGIAGGVKVADRSTGAFFKIAEDTVGIYKGSSVMADKAAKHELAMLTHLHEADAARLLTVPLASCVDVTVRDAEGRVEGVYRVQGFSRHAVSGRTLRVGSGDGGDSLHVCAALDSVAEELATGLHLAPSLVTPSFGLFTRHEYRAVRGARDAARFPQAGPATDALLARVGAGRHAAESSGVCAQVEAEHGVVLDPLRPVHAEHSATAAGDAGGVTRRLPFDVELHALPWGEVVLLDTHRLCIPDAVGDAEAAGGGGGGQVAIVWAAAGAAAAAAAASAAPSPAALHVVSLPDTGLDDEALASQAARSVGLLSGAARPERRDADLDPMASCCGVSVLESRDGHLRVLLPRPGRYWRATHLTALFRPEAAAVLREAGADTVSPDALMAGGADGDGVERARLVAAHGVLLGADNVRRAADAVEEQLVECWRSGRGDDVVSVRGAVKAGLHSRGLGLRHAWTL
ncbi:hypothetical protein FNF29_04014 [Cafeteria roenbergensis]|uniref:FH2 domain-containing protein n=1 Tax=Cafeteria roenbergensis TaxID=33653 RepID=A0A5A8CGN0_CAFRO|nr:hypothetical protein FNF29_04014 [Cafeteria roenbergensis]|eukprot:KAA0152146.1 hypothetical protein FNF29_04014 [Cafeteria roenbergensis]